MRLFKEYWKLILFIAILAVVDYFVAGIVCESQHWLTYVAWPMTGFAIASMLFWGEIAGFNTAQFFEAKVSWKKKLGPGIAAILGVVYALILLIPQVKTPGDLVSAIIIVPVLVLFTKWCANAANLLLGFFLSLFFDFHNWMRVNREGFGGLHRYTRPTAK